jgi:hypothetical protein
LGALLLFGLGYYMKNDLLRILAIILFFTCGMALDPLGGGINVPTGANVTYVLTSNTTSIGSQTDTYTNYQSHLFGWYMAITALLSLVYILIERRFPNGRD